MMKTISLLEFRKNARQILEYAERGQRIIMTYRGKPICRIEPLTDDDRGRDDPFFRLHLLADDRGIDLSNEEMDDIVYER